MSVIISTQFDGADGSPWPAPWTIVSGSGSIQNSRGRLSKTTTAWTGGGARAGVDLSRSRISGTMVVADTSQSTYQNVFIRIVDNGNYFSAEFFPPSGAWELKSWVGWSDTLLGGHGLVGIVNGTTVNFELEADGSTIHLRTWKEGDPKPTGWQIEATGRTEHPSGNIGLEINSGNAAADYMDLDYLEVDDLAVDYDPVNFTVSNSNGNAVLAWDASPTPGVSDYWVMKRDTPIPDQDFDPFVDPPFAVVSETSFVDNTVSPGQPNQFQVFGRVV